MGNEGTSKQQQVADGTNHATRQVFPKKGENLRRRCTYRSPVIPRRPILRLATVQPDALDAPPPQLLLVDPRHALAFQMDQMRHVPRPHLPPHILPSIKADAPALLAGPGDGSNEVRGAEAARLAVEAAVEDEDLEARAAAGPGDGGAHALQDEGGHDGGVEAADAVDEGFGAGDGLEGLGVGRGPHLLAVGVDVPEALDAGGQGRLGGFGEVDVGLAEGGQGTGEVGVFDRGVGEGVVVVEGGRLAGVADGVLARDDAAVGEAGGDVVRKVADDGGEDGGFGFVDAAHDGEEVDCGFEGAGEEAGTCEEEVPDRGGLEVEGRGGGPVALEDLEVEMREDGTDQHCLRRRNRMVEGRHARQEGQEFGCGHFWRRR